MLVSSSHREHQPPVPAQRWPGIQLQAHGDQLRRLVTLTSITEAKVNIKNGRVIPLRIARMGKRHMILSLSLSLSLPFSLYADTGMALPSCYSTYVDPRCPVGLPEILTPCPRGLRRLLLRPLRPRPTRWTSRPLCGLSFRPSGPLTSILQVL